MLAEQMLEMILADRRREMEAIARVRLVKVAAPEEADEATLSVARSTVASDGVQRPIRPQARTATDPSA